MLSCPAYQDSDFVRVLRAANRLGYFRACGRSKADNGTEMLTEVQAKASERLTPSNRDIRCEGLRFWQRRKKSVRLLLG